MTDLRTLQQQWDTEGAHYRVRSYRFTAPPRTRWQTALGSLPYFLPRFALIAAGMALVIGFAAMTP